MYENNDNYGGMMMRGIPKHVTLKDWLGYTLLNSSERAFVERVGSDNFPFFWDTPATLQAAMTNYRRLCPNDPNKVGAHATKTLFDILNRYAEYTGKMQRSVLETIQVQKVAQRQCRDAVKAERRALKRAKENEKLEPFVAWVHAAMPSIEDAEFKEAFERAKDEGRLHQSRFKGNKRHAMAAAVGSRFASVVDDLYARYYAEALRKVERDVQLGEGLKC